VRFFPSRCAAFALLQLLILASIPAESVIEPAPFAELAGRQVAAVLVQAEDLLPTNRPNEAMHLIVEAAAVNGDANIYGLLQANGIAPDTEAFTIVYDLNPTLRDAKILKPGTTLQLPKVVGGPILKGMLRHGYLVMLTVDPKLREELNRRAETLQARVATFAQLPPERFDSTDANEVKKNVESMGKWYAQIEKSFLRRTGPPLRHDSLVQLRDEADRLNSLLNAAVQSNRRVTAADLDQIAAIHDDVELEMQKYGQVLANEAPKADALYKVMVRIIGDDKLIQGCRVYYTNYGLYHEPPGDESNPFRDPGSGASDLLRVQNYMIWAARDGDPAHPLTKLPVKVRPWDAEPIIVTLTLAQGNQ
jgi:hypothetical protein